MHRATAELKARGIEERRCDQREQSQVEDSID